MESMGLSDAQKNAALILEARQRRAAGEFKRKITKRGRKDLKHDVYTLSCGHSIVCFANLMDRYTEWDCQICAEEWMAQASGKLKFRSGCDVCSEG